MINFATGQLFDWFVSDNQVFALVERLPSNVTGAGDVGLERAYTQIIKVADIEPGKKHHVAIRYSRGPGLSRVEYFLDGQPFTSVDNVGIPLDVQGVPYTGIYPSYGPGEDVAGSLDSFVIGHGLFSLRAATARLQRTVGRADRADMPSIHQPPAPELPSFQAALAGRYPIERELGRGGMGIVFLAREVALDRLVALKLLPPRLAAQTGVKERFLTEARTAARLSHPNIVQIYSVDEVDDFVFLAMAYVDGGTHGDRILDRGPLSNSDAVRLLREVAWALGHAHLQGVVHRDVKPDNILLDQESGRALVTDFGIAVAAADPERGGAAQVLGTAEFMSPEHAKGAPVDARGDLYSLACVGFHALSDTAPFTGESAAAVLVKHVTEPPPTVLSAAPHAPPLVATALDRCLRKDPEQRFSGGQALAEALGPQQQSGELAVPLRVFIEHSREWETTRAYAFLALSFAFPLLVASASPNVPFLGTAVLVAMVAVLLGIPVLSRARAARRLLKSGFTQADATVALAARPGGSDWWTTGPTGRSESRLT
ncbi:MAG TPA: DUF6081 family protein [Longimicrobiales bacterium]|nr:DUF6081 family protein [Longimicrobiales bacterium]